MVIALVIVSTWTHKFQAQCSDRSISDLSQLKRLSQLFGRSQKARDKGWSHGFSSIEYYGYQCILFNSTPNITFNGVGTWQQNERTINMLKSRKHCTGREGVLKGSRPGISMRISPFYAPTYKLFTLVPGWTSGGNGERGKSRRKIIFVIQVKGGEALKLTR